MTTDRSHLNALQVRLSHERGYLVAAKTGSERKLRSVWIAQIEKEIAAERAFIGLVDEGQSLKISDEELLAELGLA